MTKYRFIDHREHYVEPAVYVGSTPFDPAIHRADLGRSKTDSGWVHVFAPDWVESACMYMVEGNEPVFNNVPVTAPRITERIRSEDVIAFEVGCPTEE
jgi:hypothetical protein